MCYFTFDRSLTTLSVNLPESDTFYAQAHTHVVGKTRVFSQATIMNEVYSQGRREGGEGKGDMSPRKFPC